MKIIPSLFRATVVCACVALFLAACKTPPGPNAPLAVKPVLSRVEKNAGAPNNSTAWQPAAFLAGKYTAGEVMTSAPDTGVPTLAITFSGPDPASDYEVTVGTKTAAPGGGLQASAKQQAAEAADNPWFYGDGVNPGRFILRLPNSMLTTAGETVIRIVNISRNTAAHGKDLRSDPLEITVVIAPPPTPPAPSPTLSSITPSPIIAGQSVTINGAHFSTAPGATQIKIDGCHTLTPTNVTATAITFTAPDPLPHKIDLTLTTGTRTFNRNNLVVRRKAGPFVEATPSTAANAVNQSRPRFSITTTTIGSNSPFDTAIRQLPSGANNQNISWTIAVANTGHPGTDRAGIAVSPDGNSVLVHSSDPLQSATGGAISHFLYTGACRWTTAQLPVQQFGLRANGSLLLVVIPRIFFSPDGSVVAVVHLNYPAVEPQPTTPPQPAHLPNNIQVTVINLSTGQPVGSTLVQHTNAPFKIEMGLDGSNDAVLVTGERASFADQSDVTTIKIRL